MSDNDGKSDASEHPVPARLDADQEEEIAKLLRLAGPRPTVDPERFDRVREAAHALWRHETRARKHSSRIRWIAISAFTAASLAVILGLAAWLTRRTAPERAIQPAVLERVQGPLQRSDGGSVVEGAALHSGLGIITGAGGRAALRLPGSASVRLDSDTTLELVSGTVLKLVRGAVYVDSRGESGAAVTVRTPAGLVRELGTQFEVRLGIDDVSLTVRAGTASLELGTGPLQIQAGTRVIAGPHGEISRTRVPPNGPDWNWILEIAPPKPLEGETLGTFLVWVSRETGRQVRFADPETGKKLDSIVLHGSMEGVRPDEAPAVVLPTCGLSSHIEGDVLVITPLNAGEGPP